MKLLLMAMLSAACFAQVQLRTVYVDAAAPLPSGCLPRYNPLDGLFVCEVLGSALTLSGDVTGSLSAAVVALVGGKTALQVAGTVDTVNAATTTSVPDTLVRRNSSGNFTAGTINANLNGNASTATAFAASPTPCPDGFVARGITSTGNSMGCVSLISGAGVTQINGLTESIQAIVTGSTGTNFNISSASGVHTINIPTAASGVRGLLAGVDFDTFAAKESALTFSAPLSRSTNTISLNQAALSISFSQLTGSATDVQIPNNITVDLAATATALASNPADCAFAGQFANAIAANGDLTCAVVSANELTGTLDIARMPIIASQRILGNVTVGSAGATELTASQVKTMLGIGPSDISGNNVLINAAETVSSGTTFTVGNRTRRVFVDPASVLASLTITLPAAPQDGDQCVIVFGGTIANGEVTVTALSVVANAGQTVQQTSAAFNAVGGDLIMYEYAAATARWFRVN